MKAVWCKAFLLQKAKCHLYSLERINIRLIHLHLACVRNLLRLLSAQFLQTSLRVCMIAQWVTYLPVEPKNTWWSRLEFDRRRTSFILEARRVMPNNLTMKRKVRRTFQTPANFWFLKRTITIPMIAKRYENAQKCWMLRLVPTGSLYAICCHPVRKGRDFLGKWNGYNNPFLAYNNINRRETTSAERVRRENCSQGDHRLSQLGLVWPHTDRIHYAANVFMARPSRETKLLTLALISSVTPFPPSCSLTTCCMRLDSLPLSFVVVA